MNRMSRQDIFTHIHNGRNTATAIAEFLGAEGARHHIQALLRNLSRNDHLVEGPATPEGRAYSIKRPKKSGSKTSKTQEEQYLANFRAEPIIKRKPGELDAKRLRILSELKNA